MQRKYLNEKDIESMNLKDGDRNIYNNCLQSGGKLLLIDETADGYDVVMIFGPVEDEVINATN